MRRTFVLIAAVVASSCATDDFVDYRVDFDICDDDAPETPCGLDFGTVDLSVRVERVIGIRNRATVPAIISLSLDDGDPAFTLEGANDPIELGPRARAFFDVGARPLVESQISTVLRVLAEFADDDVEARTIALRLTANGVDNGLPDIRMSRDRCDFGDVDIGSSATCEIQLVNQGNRGLVVDELSFDACDEPCPFLFVGRPPGPDEEIGAGDVRSFSVRFDATTPGAAAATLRVATNDPDEQRADVELTGTAAAP